MRSILLSSLAAAALAGSASATVSLWDFNVFSRSTIGTSAHAYGSDYQGASGAVGDVYFSGFTVRGVANSSPSLPGGFYGGGNFTLSGSVDSGGIYVRGNVTLNSANVNGDVHAGGNLGGVGGTVTGSAILGGIKTTGNALTVNGAVLTGQSYSAPVDLDAASTYFASTAAFVGALSPTTGYTNNFGNLIVNTTGPLTVVNISSADYLAAFGITINGGGAVVVNVDGVSLNVNFKNWFYNAGASANSTLLNFSQATSLTLNAGQTVNILAANADTNFTSGLVTGNLIVKSLVGGGQVNWNGGFSGGSIIPAPAGVAAFGGLLAMGLRRRR